MKKERTSLANVTFLLLAALLLSSTHVKAEVIKETEVIKDKNSVEMKLTQLESPVQEILYCGTSAVMSEAGDVVDFEKQQKYRKIYVLTEKGQLHISSDNGFKFELVNTELNSFNSMMSSQKNITIRDIMISPVNNKKVFLLGENGSGFYTENCGVTYKPMRHDAKLHSVHPNPVNHNVLLGLTPIECHNLDSPECDSSMQNLHISQDSGSTWKQIQTNVEQAQWDIKQSHQTAKPNRIILAHYELVQSEEGQSSLRKRKVSYSDDFCTSLVLLEKGGVGFQQMDTYIFILKSGKTYGEYSLAIGSAFVANYEGKQIDLPTKGMKADSFTVLDVYEGSILITLKREGDQKGYTNFYVSNSEGIKFNLSLLYTVSDQDQNIDFEPILSNEGAYIANTYPSNSIKKNQQIASKRADERSAGNTATKVENFDLRNFKKTKISYNRGGEWHLLKAPETNVNGNPYKCVGECSLHLKGRTDLHGTKVYSTENAPGLILATGNVGQYLTNDVSELRTYLSRDGGHTWQEIHTGSHEYEIADQGGIIAMARDDKETEEIVYSLDEGDSWQNIGFKDFKFRVDEFVTEQNNEERTFIFFGKMVHSNEEVGIIGAINFTRVFKRACRGFETPGDDGSDYERWVPLNFAGKKCLFGAKVSYTRKVRDAECFNLNKVSDFRKELGTCECTSDDFECDFGYVRDEERSGKCIPINAKVEKELKDELDKLSKSCKGFYFITQGYRQEYILVVGLGGVEEMYKQKKAKCPYDVDLSEQQQQQQSDNTSDRRQQKQFTASQTTAKSSGSTQKTYDARNQNPWDDEDVVNNKPIKNDQPINSSNESVSSSGFGTTLLQFIVVGSALYVLFKYRTQIISLAIELKDKLQKKKEDDFYGGKRSTTDAEQFSLFHNDGDDDYDPEQL